MAIKPKVIGIILAFNSASMLERAYAKVPREYFNEVILVDDGSTDATLAVAHALGIKTFPHEHRGYGGNIKFGLAKALEMGADYMVMIHHDGQYDLGNVGQAITKMQTEGIDFLLGSRLASRHQALHDGMPLARYLANVGLSFFDRLILQVPLTEFHTGFRIYSRYLVETLNLNNTSDNFLYDFEVIAQAKYYRMLIAEIPVRCDYRAEHTSMSMQRSIVYAIKTFWILTLYVVSRLGFKTQLFSHHKGAHKNR